MLISTKHIFIIIIIIFLNEVLTMEVDVDIFFLEMGSLCFYKSTCLFFC